MKKIKLLLMVAMVFALFSFVSQKAKAQYYCPVTFNAISSNSYPYGWGDWSITLHNNTTDEYFYFDNYNKAYDPDEGWNVGNISEGNYTITLSYIDPSYPTLEHFDWGYGGYSGYFNGYNLPMYFNTDTTLPGTVDVVNDGSGLNINMYAY